MSCHSNEMTPLPNTAVAVIFPHLCLRSNLGGIYPEKPHRATLMNDGNGTENFTQKVIPAVPSFLALITTLLICQILAIFSAVDFCS